MSIMSIYTKKGTIFVRTNCLIFLGFSALMLGREIRLVSMKLIRWWTLPTLITLSLLVSITFTLVSFLVVGWIDYTLLSIKLTFWGRLLLWQRWRRHWGLGC